MLVPLVCRSLGELFAWHLYLFTKEHTHVQFNKNKNISFRKPKKVSSDHRQGTASVFLDYRLPQYSSTSLSHFIILTHLNINLSIFMVANPILITARVAHAYLWFYVFTHT